VSERICKKCSCRINRKGRQAGFIKKGGGTGECNRCEHVRKEEESRRADIKANPTRKRRLGPLFATMAIMGMMGPWGRDR
jgi:hypothetical protein